MLLISDIPPELLLLVAMTLKLPDVVSLSSVGRLFHDVCEFRRKEVEKSCAPLRLPPFNMQDNLVTCDEVILGRRNIGNDGMQIFSTALASGALAQCQTLHLYSNQIRDEGMEAFYKALAIGSMGKLAYLYLDGNQIGDEGMVAFSAAISSGSLASLFIGNPSQVLKDACASRNIRLNTW